MTHGPDIKSTFKQGGLDYVLQDERDRAIRYGTQDGLSARELALKLGITIRTVERYRRRHREESA